MDELMVCLCKRIRDGDIRAISAAQELGGDAVDTLPALMQWLDTPGMNVLAINALGAMGQKAAPARQKLRDLLCKKPDDGTHIVLGRALLQIGDPDAEEILVGFLTSANVVHREFAAAALYQYGNKERLRGEQILRELASDVVTYGRVGELAKLILEIAAGTVSPMKQGTVKNVKNSSPPAPPAKDH